MGGLPYQGRLFGLGGVLAICSTNDIALAFLLRRINSGGNNRTHDRHEGQQAFVLSEFHDFCRCSSRASRR